jgi:hypothetical protein
MTRLTTIVLALLVATGAAAAQTGAITAGSAASVPLLSTMDAEVLSLALFEYFSQYPR